MGINRGLERKRFDETQKRLRKQYIEAGMTEEQIQAIYEFDLKQFNRDLAYRRYNQSLSCLEESDLEEESYSPLLRKFPERLAIWQKPSESSKHWWLDEIEDEELLSNLKQLTDEELALIHMLAFCDLSQEEIGIQIKKSQSAISQKLKTIRKKLKKSD